MTPPRLVDRLLARVISNVEAMESIKGDLYEEYRTRPAALRDVWYVWHASRIGFGYALTGAVRRRREDPRFQRGSAGALGRDCRYAFRMWQRRPGFTALTVATLGLGIGATTSIVSVVDRVLLQPLPYPDAHELATIWNAFPSWRGHEVLDPFWDEVHLSYPEYVDWRDGQSTFQRVAIYSTARGTLTGTGDPALIGFGAASASLFPMLGAGADLGRLFTAAEEGAGGSRVAVVSHPFWVTRLGAAQDAPGRVITIDGEQYEIVGVLRPGFRVHARTGLTTATPDVWVPAGLFGDAHDRGWHRYEAIGRLRSAVSVNQAAADIGPLLRGGADPSRMGVRVLPRQAEEVASARGPLLMLLLASALLMTIAGVNVATLFTAEASKRGHEFATRRALGASRRHIAQQLTVESGSIGLSGAVAGIVVAIFGVPALLALAPPDLGLPDHVPLDFRMLLATGAFGVVVGIVFGVVPNLLAARGVGARLSVRTSTSHRTIARLQRSLIAVEAALSIILLVGTGLLGRTLLAMQAVDPGFRRQNVLAVSLPLSGPATQPERVIQLARELVTRLGNVPGIGTVTGTNAAPFSGEGGSSSFEIEGRPVEPGEKHPEAHRRSVLPGFHETLGIPLLAGRTLLATDREDARGVVVVSRSLAERFWPDRSPIGEFLIRDQQRWEIVGVVDDILHRDLTAEPQSTFYFPFYQQPPNRFWLLVSSPLPAEQLIPTIRGTVTAVAPSVAVGRVDALAHFVDESTASARYRATLIAVFGACSLVLAAIGIFGLTARMVSARRRELGIRLALGARQATITRTVLVTEAWAIGIGIAAGLLLSMIAVRGLGAFLFGVSPYDAGTFLAAAAVLSFVGFIACYVPAHRTTLFDPVEVLRVE